MAQLGRFELAAESQPSIFPIKLIGPIRSSGLVVFRERQPDKIREGRGCFFNAFALTIQTQPPVQSPEGNLPFPAKPDLCQPTPSKLLERGGC